MAEFDARTAHQHENVDQIKSAGAHLLELVDEILDISSIDAGRIALTIKPVSLANAIKRTFTLVGPMAAEENVKLAESICDQYVLADEKRLGQVLKNLLENAIKYNTEGGSVTVTCEPTSPGFVRIEVKDTGPGIDPSDMATLFQPFQRLHNRGETIEGSGLGLTISRRLMKAMGGSIGVESERGAGSVFWIELPVTDQRSNGDEAPAAIAAFGECAFVGLQRTLLYIEDNPSNAEVVGLVISSRPDLKMITAPQGSSGLEMAREQRPALILLDLHLPDINGDEVLTRLKSDPQTATIPVVMLSADAIGAEIERLKKLGACAYVTKPFQIPELLQVIDEALAGSRTPSPAPTSTL